MNNFLQASNDLLGPADCDGMAVARGGERRQQLTWERFWEAIELQRLLVDNREVWESRFTHPMVEALTVAEVMAIDKDTVVWASGDATLERVAAIDWSSKQAFSVAGGPLETMVRQFMKEASEESGSTAVDEEEHSGFVIAIMELLAVVTLVAKRAPEWAGKMVLYGGDNRNVISWLDRRQARHPVANFLLQVLAAIEATYSIRTQGAFLRTYHYQTADALTRADAEDVMAAAGLEPMSGAEEALKVYLERGWTRRALLWAGQADADRGQALRLAQRRNTSTIPPAVSDDSRPLMKFEVLEVGLEAHRYVLECLMRGAKGYGLESKSAEVAVWMGDELQKPSFLCCTIPAGAEKVSKELRRGVIHARPMLVWIDSQTQTEAQKAGKFLRSLAYDVRHLQVSGRTLKDQVWWRRWVVVASAAGEPNLPCIDAAEEPQTEIPRQVDAFWFNSGDEEGAVSGVLRLDPNMPYLGSATPKPVGTVRRQGSTERRLVWSAERPLPSLHRGSWEANYPSNLLLHVQGKLGPVARPLKPQEAVTLLEGKPGPCNEDEAGQAASQLLAMAPRSLARLAAWAGRQLEAITEEVDKVGLCKLKWEDETERVLLEWLEANPPRSHEENEESPGRVGGRRGRERKDKQPGFRESKDLSRVLRHEAGTEERGMGPVGPIDAASPCEKVRRVIPTGCDPRQRQTEVCLERGC